jgi:NAD(P)-dependent dehydrogenase (short-subunit alcohol dehydrogenase family)
VVNVGSGLGSMHRATDPAAMGSAFPGPAYQSSKAAVNMPTVQWAKPHPGIRVDCVDPGHAAADPNGHRGARTVEVGAEIIVRMAMIGPDGPIGGYFDAAGAVPWVGEIVMRCCRSDSIAVPTTTTHQDLRGRRRRPQLSAACRRR